MGKTYKASYHIFSETGEGNGEAMDLINIDNPFDVLMAAPDEFEEDEIVNEEDIHLDNAGYVDDHGVGNAEFAFKLPKLSQPAPAEISEASIVDELKVQLDYYMRRCAELESRLSHLEGQEDGVF